MLAAAGEDVRVYRTPSATYLFPDEVHALLYQDLVYATGWPHRPSALRVEGYVRLAAGCLPAR